MNGVNVCFNFKVSEHSLRALYDFILVPRAAILWASALEQELWQGQKTGSPRIMDFQLSVQPQKFETITVTISYKNG